MEIGIRLWSVENVKFIAMVFKNIKLFPAKVFRPLFESVSLCSSDDVMILMLSRESKLCYIYVLVMLKYIVYGYSKKHYDSYPDASSELFSEC